MAFIETNPALQGRIWPAKWACHPHALTEVGEQGAVFLFRRAVSLDAVPERYVVHVSADQRFRLFVNGVSVGFGPARGDLLHWRYQTFDLAPYLRVGENILAARVHFFAGENAPVAQISSGLPGFLLQADSDSAAAANTPNGWRVTADAAYTFTSEPAGRLRTYAVVGPSEIFAADRHPQGWQQPGFDDSGWHEARTLKQATASGTENAESHWWLVPDTLPQREETPVAFGHLCRSEGVSVPAGFGAPPDVSLTIAPHTRATLLFDHGANTCVFPGLAVSGGAGGTITLSYAEGLHEIGTRPDQHAKGNRNEIDNKILRGYTDTWKPRGGSDRENLDTLWWRTFRYAELTVETADEPLTIHDITASYTGYPWERTARFDAPEMPELNTLRDIGWRTLRLCSHETFMDCPYYEQLQYAGDTRIQCFVSLYETGDPRLFANALRHFDDSRAAFGLTMSRYPSRIPQVIPPFSLWWVCMVEDYRQHVPGSETFVRSLLPGVRAVLEWFAGMLRADNLLGPLPHWNFVDWCRGGEWKGGVPPGAREGGSSIVTLQFVLALQAAARLFAECGQDAPTAERYARLARETSAAVWERCLRPDSPVIADTPGSSTASQHGNIFAILSGAARSEQEQQALLDRVLTDPDLTQATFYCRFYLGRALSHTGNGDRYLGQLQPWHDMLAMGLTTWAENPEPTRSDCHAWSAAPNYELLAQVLGITPDAPGWARTRIAPHLGALTRASGTVPISGGGHVSVVYERNGENGLHAEITLPESGPGSTGTLHWHGATRDLHSGKQQITF